MSEVVKIALGNIIALFVWESLKAIVYQMRMKLINNELSKIIEKLKKEKL